MASWPCKRRREAARQKLATQLPTGKAAQRNRSRTGCTQQAGSSGLERNSRLQLQSGKGEDKRGRAEYLESGRRMAEGGGAGSSSGGCDRRVGVERVVRRQPLKNLAASDESSSPGWDGLSFRRGRWRGNVQRKARPVPARPPASCPPVSPLHLPSGSPAFRSWAWPGLAGWVLRRLQQAPSGRGCSTLPPRERARRPPWRW